MTPCRAVTKPLVEARPRWKDHVGHLLDVNNFSVQEKGEEVLRYQIETVVHYILLNIR